MSVIVKANTKAWEALLRVMHKLDRHFVKVGVLASKGGEAKHEDGKMSLIEIAATHEFGSSDGRIPERSFIRQTFFVNAREELVKMQAELAKKIVTGGMDPLKALGILGTWGAAAVKKTITDQMTSGPENAPSTIARKGSSTPLIDTGLLKNSVSHEVVTNGDGTEATTERR